MQFFSFIFYWATTSTDIRTIRPLPCSNRMTGEFGVCTFNWSCINVAHGVHIGPCVDRFFVGSCCKIPQGTAEQGQGSRKPDAYPYSGASAGTSNNGVGEGTRKVGEMPPHSQLHHTVAPKAQKEKLKGGKPIYYIDIGHFNVSLSPKLYYDPQYNRTSLQHHEQSSKLNNATDFEQNPSVDYRNFSSSSTQELIPPTSFFHAVFLPNYSKSGSSKESLNGTVDSVIPLLGKNDSSTHPHTSTNHGMSLSKETSSYPATSSVPVESPFAFGRPVTFHHSHDERKPLKPHEQHDLRKPVGHDTTHDLRRPVTSYYFHDERKPLKPHDQHDQRWPVYSDMEEHDQRWPVLEEDDNNERLPPTKEESHDQRLPISSDDNRLSIEHLFRWIGNNYTNANQISSSTDYPEVIPTVETKTTVVSTNTMLNTVSPPSHFSEESTVLNFGQQNVASTKATITTSFKQSTNSLSNFTLFVRPTSSRPSYKPYHLLPPEEPRPTVGKLLLNDTSQVCGRSRSGTTARIVGGIKSHYLRWPWMISLRRRDGQSYKHKCGATLLNQYWAVTAAHCIDGKLPRHIILRLGEYNFRRADEHPYEERRIYLMVIHPDFDRVTYENDLALLRFQEPVQLQANIVPVCLPRNLDDITGRIGVVTGWGRLSEDGELPTSLHEVHLPIVSNKECEEMYSEAGYNEKIRDVFVCAGVSDGGLDACEGDSGGPMVIRGDYDEWILVGLISWGMGCAAPKQPGVYTRISEFTEWIDDIIAH